MIQRLRPRSALAWAALSLPTAFVVVGVVRPDEGSEPPMRFFLERDDTRTPVRLGQPFDFVVGDQKVRLTLQVEPTRLLDLPALSLEYPRQMPFEYKTDGEYTSWALDGNSALLTVQRLESPAGLKPVFDEFVQQMRGMFGDGVRRDQPTTMRLHGRELQGRKLDLEITGTALSMDLLPLCVDDGHAWLLMLQDTLTDDGHRSDEMKEVRRVLEASFRFKQK
jgi:hypothetical protein